MDGPTLMIVQRTSVAGCFELIAPKRRQNTAKVLNTETLGLFML